MTHQQRPARPSKSSPVYDAVIFDIDNVLVDTRYSYLEAIRWTVEIYLTSGTVPLFSPTKQNTLTLLSAQDVDDFKLLGGFNDDWDCCYGILVYLLTLPIKKRNLVALKQKMNIKEFARQVKTRPLGVNGIVKILERPTSVKIEKIARIFQEVYLGKDLLQVLPYKKPVYWNKRGLIQRERLIFKKPILEQLRNKGIQLGISTGRSRFEAQYALKRFGVLDLFDAFTTIDEVKKAERLLKQSLRKPHPYSLIETANRIGKSKRFLYEGDLPDDILAVNQAKQNLNIHSVAFPALGRNPRLTLAEMQKAKPDFVIHKPRELLNITK